MEHQILVSIAAIIILGIVGQWLAWRFEVPSILLLLTFGLVAGPVTGYLDPDALLGDVFYPFVSIAVGIILFEGGLSLRFAEIPGVKNVIFRLISIGVLITWIIGSWAAHSLLNLELQTALVLGAILTVSGPTVIIPILRDVRLRGRLGSILKWEGILIDPVGAIFAVLVYEAIAIEEASSATSHVITGVLQVFFVGTAIGIGAALLLKILLQRFWVPDFLQNSVSLMFVVTAYTASHLIYRESGLLSVTVMGVTLANTRGITVRHILEFKESLRVILLSTLFIVLAARLKPEHLSYLDFNAFLFLLILILIARPISVFASTYR